MHARLPKATHMSTLMHVCLEIVFTRPQFLPNTVSHFNMPLHCPPTYLFNGLLCQLHAVILLKMPRDFSFEAINIMYQLL